MNEKLPSTLISEMVTNSILIQCKNRAANDEKNLC